MKNYTLYPALLLILLLAGFLRFTHLDSRPMHTDESTNTLIFKTLLEGDGYKYRPDDYHGPALHYLTLAFYRAQGTESFIESTRTTYRIIPVVFGLGTVALLLAFRRWIGTAAALGAALLCAISPICLFYSRYYIHETMYVFTILVTILAGAAYCTRPTLWRAVALGLGVGFMHAFKETCVIAWFTMAVGAAAVWFTSARDQRTRWRWTHAGIAIAVALIVWVAFYSSMFTYWGGLKDSIKAYFMYSDRAQEFHQYPWWKYLQWLFWYHTPPLKIIWSEAVIGVLALIGTAAAVLRKTPGRIHVGFARFIAIYSFGSLIIFSAIGYKTPWNALPFMLGFILLAGIGIAALIDWLRHPALRAGLAIVLAAGLWHLLSVAQYTIMPRFEYDPRNPYVYSHTVKDIDRLAERAHAIAALSDRHYAMPIQILTDPFNYWPLPWELRRFEQVGYYHEWVTPLLSLVLKDTPRPSLHGVASLEQIVREDAAMIIAEPVLAPELREILGDRYISETRGLRPDVHLQVYIRKDLWDRFLATRK